MNDRQPPTATPVIDPATAAARSPSWDAALRRHAHLRPADVALRCAGSVRTWAELDRRVDQVAAALAARGVARGDRVALLAANSIEFVETVLGATRAGAIPVPLNFRLAAAEVAALLADCDARALVVDQPRAGLAPSGGNLAACWVVADPAHDAPVDPTAARPDAEAFEAAVASGAGRAPLAGAAIGADDPAVILYTSGTTGRPKGAVLTHQNLAVQTMTILWTWRLQGADDVLLCSVPLFHVAGLASLYPSVLVGATTVIMPSATFDPDTFVDACERHRITGVFLVPTQWAAVCALPGVRERDLCLRFVSWGASPASKALLEAMSETFPGVPNIASFGQTEMSPVTCTLRAEDTLRKIGSVGRPVPWVDVRIVDDRGDDVAPGAVGEIVYRGPGLMAGYWAQPEATAEAMRGGWFHSGDLVRMDDEGFIYVVDRKKDMIISGGENIYSAEVEEALSAHPSVEEVAVVGAPHPAWVESPVAVMVPTPGADLPPLEELRRWCSDRLAAYKHPRAIVAVDSLPRNASGKVLKTALRQQYQSIFAGEQAPAERMGKGSDPT